MHFAISNQFKAAYCVSHKNDRYYPLIAASAILSAS